MNTYRFAALLAISLIASIAAGCGGTLGAVNGSAYPATPAEAKAAAAQQVMNTLPPPPVWPQRIEFGSYRESIDTSIPPIGWEMKLVALTNPTDLSSELPKKVEVLDTTDGPRQVEVYQTTVGATIRVVPAWRQTATGASWQLQAPTGQIDNWGFIDGDFVSIVVVPNEIIPTFTVTRPQRATVEWYARIAPSNRWWHSLIRVRAS